MCYFVLQVFIFLAIYKKRGRDTCGTGHSGIFERNLTHLNVTNLFFCTKDSNKTIFLL